MSRRRMMMQSGGVDFYTLTPKSRGFVLKGNFPPQDWHIEYKISVNMSGDRVLFGMRTMFEVFNYWSKNIQFSKYLSFDLRYNNAFNYDEILICDIYITPQRFIYRQNGVEIINTDKGASKQNDTIVFFNESSRAGGEYRYPFSGNVYYLKAEGSISGVIADFEPRKDCLFEKISGTKFT